MNEELTEAKYDAAVEEIVNIVPAVMEQLVAITDKNNIDLILCLVKLISTIAEISAFKTFDESKNEKGQDFCDKSTASLVKELEK
mgnify:CR=1 FL=1